VSLVCQKMFTTRECVRGKPGFSQCLFFSAITPGQHVREPTEWFIRKLGIEEAGPLKLSHSPSGGVTGDVAIPDTLAIVPE
jgi:hypothetical protein